MSKNPHHENVEHRFVRVTVIGQISAGKGVEYLPIVRWIEVTLPRWARSSDRFVAAEICGNSLIGDHICDGDFVLVHLTKEVGQGNLAAIIAHGNLLIKHFYLETETDPPRVRLESNNPDYPPIYFDLAEVSIKGRAVKIVREL